ncbi:MAG: UvrD-helicase domain-containing protein [Clostridia bacterium]|nr:UvrD-helicase domain-containing protein [Clostridia bacterium]
MLDEEVLNSVKSEYDFIFIDEYQDVNGIQEKIINLLAQNNEFMVGDSKQSIYAFRGCNPNYFISKYNAYNDEKNADKHAIGLDYNFRSASNVIKSVNNVFSRVFTKNFGGFDYKDSPMVFNDKYQHYEGDCTLHFYSENAKTKKEHPCKIYSVKDDFNLDNSVTYKNQVLLIASLIHKALNEFYYDVKEKDENKRFKKIKLSDICILFRNLNETNIKVIQELNTLGIPVTAEAKIKLSSYPEIQEMIQLIKAIISLNDDIAISTTMSTIYGFTFDELATIRKSEDVKLTFYDAVISFSKKDGTLNEKVKAFLDAFEKVRLYSEYEKADEILYRVLDESGYESRILTSPFGEYKLKRVKRLINESNKNKKLTIKEFGAYLEDAFEDISTCETSGDDACKVMTIHASKGLEFPYVILAGTSSKFNFSDIEKGRIIKNEKYGITIKHHDKETMTISETPLTLFVKNQSYLNASLEEARVLYVAMTRAMYKLDVIAKKNVIYSGIPFFIKHPNCFSEFFTENDMPICDHDEFVDVTTSSATLVAGSIGEEETINALINNFNYVYPYIQLTKMPVKVSVSDVSHRDDDEYFETTSLFGTTNKEMGTAYHKILQLIDFYAPRVEDEIERLKKCNLITNEDLSFIEIDKIKSILSMDIFNIIKDYTLYKEEKFTFFISPNELGYSACEKTQDKVLVQGIIDLMAIKDDKCILIDYKLSSLKRDEDLIKTYKTQLTLYKNAIQDCLNVMVEKVYLVNILQEKLIEIK